MAMGFAVAQQMIQQPGGIAGTQQPSAASPQGAGAGSPELLTPADAAKFLSRSEEHTSELQSQSNLVCRLLLEKKKKKIYSNSVSQTETTAYISTKLVISTSCAQSSASQPQSLRL